MDIKEESRYSEILINEARKLNPAMGYFVKVTSEPLKGDVTVKLTNGSVVISSLALLEFRRSGKKKTPKSFIEEIAGNFQPE
jgi:hypothetical protein